MNLKSEHHIEDDRKEDWWRTWFNTIYMDVYAHRNDAQAREEVRTSLSVLPVQPRHHIVDLCCGNGRHSRALFDAGFQHITGIDYSYPLLKHAVSANPQIQYVRGDMRMLPLQGESQDVLLTFFTSFGYFQTNTENLSVLHEAARVLKPGGWFLLDYLNPKHVEDHFEPESIKEMGEYQIIERRQFSENHERIEKEITIKNWGNGDRTFFESVRLYSYQDMTDMLTCASLHVLGCMGAFDGRAFDSNSPRMILYGMKS